MKSSKADPGLYSVKKDKQLETNLMSNLIFKFKFTLDLHIFMKGKGSLIIFAAL